MTVSAGPIPVTVVSGFLGSGKTTLVRGLLADQRSARAALVVNEFGEAGIDHHLLRRADERITLLRGGCACCALRDDLVDALRGLLDQPDGAPIDRVILETTGLADPGPILHTLVSDPVLRHRVRIDRVVVTVDAIAGPATLAAHPEALRQLAAADLVVLTKLDLAAPGREAELRALVGTVNPTVDVAAADRGRIDPDLVLSAASPPRPIHLPPVSGLPPHAAPGDVSSTVIVLDGPVDLPMLGVWLTLLLHRHGERLLRVKGLLQVGADGPLLLEGVQHAVQQPRHLAAWPDDDRRSRLVLIARGLDLEAVRASLETFLAVSAGGRG